MGQYYLDEEERIVPTANMLRSLPNGYWRGADFARILGVKEQLISYHSDGAAQHAAEEALLSVGWRCILPESPETFAVMRRGVLLFPVVLTLEKEDEQMTLGLYTARSALCVVNLRRVLKKWLEAVPLELKPIASTAEPGEGKKEA